jgi:hypothetical protein
MLLFVNCALSSPMAPAGSRAFEQNAVEDLDLTKMVALGFKELAPLLDGRCHNWVVIFCERYVGPIRFEEILVNVEAWAEGFQSGLQPHLLEVIIVAAPHQRLCVSSAP